MSDDTIKTKYDCLKAALTHSGVEAALPPKAEKAKVTEHAPWGHAPNDPGLHDQAAFSYKTTTGQTAVITSESGPLVNETEPHFIEGNRFSVTTYDIKDGIASNVKAGPHVTTDVFSGKEYQTGGLPVKEGTALKTAHMIGQCRSEDMKMRAIDALHFPKK